MVFYSRQCLAFGNKLLHAEIYIYKYIYEADNQLRNWYPPTVEGWSFKGRQSHQGHAGKAVDTVSGFVVVRRANIYTKEKGSVLRIWIYTYTYIIPRVSTSRQSWRAWPKNQHFDYVGIRIMASACHVFPMSTDSKGRTSSLQLIFLQSFNKKIIPKDCSIESSITKNKYARSVHVYTNFLLSYHIHSIYLTDRKFRAITTSNYFLLQGVDRIF